MEVVANRDAGRDETRAPGELFPDRAERFSFVAIGGV
jgi:hypothetical protein